ncbi:MAG: sialate O-acetylesterase, partial [Planctomycetota bacterium]|jgi:hypothetical protein
VDWNDGNQHQVGPEIGLLSGLNLKEAGLIKVAVGGTSLQVHWKPDERDGFTLLNATIAIVEEARKQKDIEIIAVVWLQGESDTSKEEAANAYAKRYDTLIKRLRKELDLDTVPFIGVRINPPIGKGGKFKYSETVRSAITDYTGAHYAWVDADGLPKNPDELHYTVEGELAIGQRCHQAFIELTAGKGKGKRRKK